MRSIIAVVGIFFSCLANSDITIDQYPLGTSTDDVTQKLLQDGFYIHAMSKDSISARKLAIDLDEFSAPPMAEFPNMSVSTEITLTFCEKKLFRQDVKSYYFSGNPGFWSARKAVYQYLDDNKAILKDIRLAQKPEDNNVGFAYTIDRSALGGAAKGEENVIVGIYLPIKPTDRENLSLKYRLENKWFCPE